MNAEYGLLLDNSLVAAAQFDFTITDMRLWDLTDRNCIWESLVRGLTGWLPTDHPFPDDVSDDDTVSTEDGTVSTQDLPIGVAPIEGPVVGDVIEYMLSLYPDIRRIRDCRRDYTWSHRYTVDLIENVYRDCMYSH